MEPPTLTTENLVLTPPASGDLKAINEFEVRNKNHLANWESTTCLKSKDASLNLTTQNRLEEWLKECEEGIKELHVDFKAFRNRVYREFVDKEKLELELEIVRQRLNNLEKRK